MESFVLPIPVTKSLASGGIGAEPNPWIILFKGNFNSWTLWIATSSTLETTWIVPVIDVVGVKIKVKFSELILQSLEILVTISSGGNSLTSRIIEVGEQAN